MAERSASVADIRRFLRLGDDAVGDLFHADSEESDAENEASFDDLELFGGLAEGALWEIDERAEGVFIASPAGLLPGAALFLARGGVAEDRRVVL